MDTFLAKRKKGNGFYRITEKGKTIKDFTIGELREKIKKHNPAFVKGIRFEEKHKSLLWKICIDNKLV